MRPNSASAPLSLWSAAYLGCAAFLLLGLLPSPHISPTLLGELSWLALLGSVPTALVLGAAARISKARAAIQLLAALAIAGLGTALAWQHTDFLLSGPHWALHPQRALVHAGLALALGLAGALGWGWLAMGAELEAPRKRVGWTVVSFGGVALLAFAISRYRAYDYSIAQAVFPGGVLCAACVRLLGRVSGRTRLMSALAICCALPGVVSRVDSSWVSTGEREVVAYSRAGALATLYLLPHAASLPGWSETAMDCPPPRQVLESAPVPIAPDKRRNVIIVTVDALRSDVVGAVENAREVTPTLSKLAKRSVWFGNATTTYPATLFAIGSAFTGLSPAELYLSPALPETLFTRSRSVVDQQIVVWPDVSWFRLPIVKELLTPGVEPELAPNDAAATRALVARLRAARQERASVMAWIHYYSPHAPYVPQPSFGFGKGERNAYLSEVAYFDHQLGELLRYLEDDGWMEDTLVVFFSDHGEALGERRYYGHHVYLDGWMVDVPMALWHAELEPSKPRVGVSVADLAPTVLHFLGLPMPSNLESQSLFSLDPNLANRATFAEAFPVRGRALFESFRLPALDDAAIEDRLRSIRVSNKGYEPKVAITDDHHRLVHHRSANTAMVYERSSDGAERRLGTAEGREVSELLRAKLEHWESEQLSRIQCRLGVRANAADPVRR